MDDFLKAKELEQGIEDTGDSDFCKMVEEKIKKKIDSELTLRDYFAAKAMQAIIGTSACPYFARDNVEGLISENAYSIADAMLKRREDT